MAEKKLSSIGLAEAAQLKGRAKYVLRLYVAGITQRSERAIRTITEICDQYLQGRYSLEIIDIYKNPTLAKGEQIIAAPTLIKVIPAPLRRLIGDMADKDKVLLGLDIKRIEENKTSRPKNKAG